MYSYTIIIDPLTAFAIVLSQKVSVRNNQIALKYHHVKDLLETVRIDVESVTSDVQAADILSMVGF